ncbi:aldo/keto reductase [Streptomyces iconiensis]|uniref:Aldo/keto reductase n=1 Tax=Streptomyces iconiensis TaxID=1384038 RepID=A0ABT7A5P1_9ACTN|nr:aldo/keto reductase [Streptomyces iconiensis]MDJ1136377.1 aldo/keto reductase [Streptomyces iconiensis]
MTASDEAGTGDGRTPRLGLGCAQLGNLGTAMTEERAHAVVGAALDVGCTHFDTAPHYGVGLSEERLGRALAGVPRGSYTLSTKVGRRLRPLRAGEQAPSEGFVDTPPRVREWDFTRDGVHRTLEASLKRLGTDHVETVYLHDVENHLPEVLATGYAALAELRAQKVVRAIGFGMNFSGALARLVTELDVDEVLCAGRWTLLDRSAHDDLLPACVRRGTRVVAGGVYNSGLLADPRPGAHFDYQPASPERVERAQRTAAVCARHGVPVRAAALRFPFAHPAVTSAVVGASSPEEVRENARLFTHDIPQALWQDLVTEHLLGADLPVPPSLSPPPSPSHFRPRSAGTPLAGPRPPT